jgi:hypothetical protein
MMTEQELYNLIRGKSQSSIASIVQEIMQLSLTLEGKARELASHHAALSKNDEAACCAVQK